MRNDERAKDFPNPEEPFPMSPVIKVIKAETVYKTVGKKTWWCAVILGNVGGHNKVLVYLWTIPDGKERWERVNKLSINFAKNWDDMFPIIEKYVKEGGI